MIFNWRKKIKKSISCVNIQFFMDNIKMKRKQDKKNLTFPNGYLNPGFLNKFPPTIWILREIRSIELTVLKQSRRSNKQGKICQIAWTLSAYADISIMTFLRRHFLTEEMVFCFIPSKKILPAIFFSNYLVISVCLWG